MRGRIPYSAGALVYGVSESLEGRRAGADGQRRPSGGNDGAGRSVPDAEGQYRASDHNRRRHQYSRRHRSAANLRRSPQNPQRGTPRAAAQNFGMGMPRTASLPSYATSFPDIRPMFRCPSCHAALDETALDRASQCSSCNLSIENVEGIPLLVRDRQAIEATIAEAKQQGHGAWYTEPQLGQWAGP